ncbi:hypothetical protein [Paracoccus sp. S4493]|uniref:hypothetical protein n=1 Tax=Paracoccus sp. S4493 TaxID=579490 RepID=UPI000697B63F|nr:hypothetical protein [Paracoccus sp. S4493]
MRIILMALLALPLPAHAFTARNGMEARQVDATDIAVPFEAGRTDTDYWCAAGDLAQQVMNQPVATRIWRASPKPREAGQGILFTLDPARQAHGAGLSQFGSGPRDGALSIGQAVASHCRIIIPFIRDR